MNVASVSENSSVGPPVVGCGTDVVDDGDGESCGEFNRLPGNISLDASAELGAGVGGPRSSL